MKLSQAVQGFLLREMIDRRRRNVEEGAPPPTVDVLVAITTDAVHGGELVGEDINWPAVIRFSEEILGEGMRYVK